MLSNMLRRDLMIGAAFAAICAVSPAMAKDVTLDMPSMSAVKSIPLFAKQAGLQIVAPADKLAGVTTPALKGTFDHKAALHMLLQGTGLRVVSDDGSLVVLRLSSAGKISALDAAQAGAAGAEMDIENVVVTGYRSSLTKALIEKRNATNVIEVISAEDIGKFPANNLAEALQHVPGISITRDRGEGVFVRVRGLGGKFQNVTIDGRSAAVNENVRDSGQYGRQFRFDVLAAELVSSVEVIKSPLASMDEGAIGGTINIRTFKPLDFAEPTLALSLSENYVELADKIDPRTTALFSWNTDDHSFGVLMSLNYTHRSLRSDRITGAGWAKTALDLDSDGSADTEYTASSFRPTLERENRNRYGASLSLQWRPTASTEITVSDLFTHLDDHYDELTYSSDFDYSRLNTSSAVVRDGVLVGGTTRVSTQIGHEIDGLMHDNNLLDIKVTHESGALKLSGDIYWGNAYSTTADPITRTRVLGSAADKYIGNIDFSIPAQGEGVPSLDFLDTDLNSDPLAFRRIEWRIIDSLDSEVAGQLDGEYALNWGPVSKLTAGVKYRDRFRRYTRRDVNLTKDLGGVTVGKTGGGKVYDLSYFDAFPVDDFLGEVSGNLPKAWLVPNYTAFWNALDTSSIDSGTFSDSDKRNSYHVVEKIWAGYVAADIDTELFGLPLRGEAGLRIANTEQVSEGFATTSSSGFDVSYTKRYTDILPSLSLVMEASDDLQVHASMAKVITRPSLADISPRLTLNSSGTIFEATGGNPLLKPFEAMQYDMSGEWYYAPGAALIGGVFYKDITTFVYSQNTHISVDGQDYLLTAPVNGGNAWVMGFELAWQQNFDFLPAPFDGLGALANYTYTDTEATYSDALKDAMQDVAKNSYNLTVFYEKGDLGARLSYSWVDDVLNSVGTGGLDSLNDKAYGSLDGNLSYKISDTLTAVVEAQNITSQAEWKFAANGMFAGYTYNGRTISFGIRAKF